MKRQLCLAAVASAVFSNAVAASGATEFCLSGKLDLGARLQGLAPKSGETYPTTWCVVSEDDSDRILFSAAGKSNPDMDGSWTVAYLPPDTVRIVNRDAPPDIEFIGVDNFVGAARMRRLDPRRLLDDVRAASESPDDLIVEIDNDRVVSVRATADFPLLGRVPVEWEWTWQDPQRPLARLLVDDVEFFVASGHWRALDDAEVSHLYATTPGEKPVEVGGDRWPARINMRLLTLTDNVYLVRGVRTGFQHLVVDTDEGLVIADAPAGWLEIHHIPPSDLVPGLGVSGLSEQLIDFLGEEFPDREIAAVALTHLHDDHAGGARAFSAAGADVYAPDEVADFLSVALNRPTMPADRLAEAGGSVEIKPLATPVTIGREPNRVRLIPMPPGPHVNAMLGVLAVDAGYFFVSDVHVPRSEDDAPAVHRAETECWFAEWAVSSLPPETRVANSHSAVVTPLARLSAYLSSDACGE